MISSPATWVESLINEQTLGLLSSAVSVLAQLAVLSCDFVLGLDSNSSEKKRIVVISQSNKTMPSLTLSRFHEFLGEFQ